MVLLMLSDKVTATFPSIAPGNTHPRANKSWESNRGALPTIYAMASKAMWEVDPETRSKVCKSFLLLCLSYPFQSVVFRTVSLS